MINAVRMLLILLFAAVIGGGCRNHLEYVEDVKIQHRKTELQSFYSIWTPTPTPNDSEVRFRVDKHLPVLNETVEVKALNDWYTPYQGWREIYEVPTGIVLFPVAIVSHVFCACTFAMFPFRYAVFLTDFSFSCMNPAMNAEMRSRAEHTLVESSERLIDSETKTGIKPASNQPLVLKSGGNLWEILTDDKGEAEFRFLSLTPGSLMLGKDDREISVTAGNTAEPQLKLIISRSLLTRLEQGYAVLLAYQRAPSGAQLAKSVSALEKLQFVKLAYELENTELKARSNDPAYLNEFRENR
mgnify:CR=1 FL=1|jgi:hypothetical protein